MIGCKKQSTAGTICTNRELVELRFLPLTKQLTKSGIRGLSIGIIFFFIGNLMMNYTTLLADWLILENNEKATFDKITLRRIFL